MNNQEDMSMNDSDSTVQSEKSIWPRVLYMILFAIIFSISETVLYLVAIVNLIFLIVKKELHQGLRRFGDSLTNYLQQIARYLTFNSEHLPFPFNEWPSTNSSNSY